MFPSDITKQQITDFEKRVHRWIKESEQLRNLAIGNNPMRLDDFPDLLIKAWQSLKGGATEVQNLIESAGLHAEALGKLASLFGGLILIAKNLQTCHQDRNLPISQEVIQGLHALSEVQESLRDGMEDYLEKTGQGLAELRTDLTVSPEPESTNGEPPGRIH